MVKKIGIVIGCLLGAFLIAAIVLPFVIDVDKFRPQIVQAVDQNINGDFKLGKLQLSLWGGVMVKIESLSITGRGATKPLLETDSAYIEIPFLSLITFHPTLTAVLVAPKVDVIKQKNGKLNVMELVKEKVAQVTGSDSGAKVARATTSSPGVSAATAGNSRTPASNGAAANANIAPAAPPAPAAGAAASPQIPEFVANASVGIRVKKGNFSFVDEIGGGKYYFNGVELNVQNLGLRETIKVSLELPVKGSSPQMNFDGVIAMNAHVTPIMSGGMVRSASGLVEVDASPLSFEMNKGMVVKTPKMPMKLSLDFDGTESDLRIKSADVRFGELALNAKGVVTLQPQQAVQIEVKSESLPLGSLEQIVPMLKEYSLGGNASLIATAQGALDKIAAKGEFGISGGKVSYPAMLKGPLSLELRTAFTQNSFNLTSLTVNGPGTDMALHGTVQNFMAPQFNFAFSSKQIDIDQFLKLDAAGAKKKTAYNWPVFNGLALIETAEAANPAKAPKKAPHGVKNKTAAHAAAHSDAVVADKAPANTGNPMLAMAKNPMIMGAQGTFSANIDKLIAYGFPITNIQARTGLKNMVFSLDSASLKAFEGVMNAKANADLKSPGLNYSSSGTVKGVSAKNALATAMPKFKDTLEGTLNASWNISGAAFPEAARMRSIAGTANVLAENGRIKSINIQDSIDGVMAKVPFLKGKASPKLDEGFKTMRADIKIAGGVIDANPLEITGEGQNSLNIKGKSRILENMTQETFVDVYDPNRLLPSEISNGRDVALALHITGPVSSPQTDYGYTVSRLAKNVIQNKGQDLVKQGLKKFLGGGSGGDGGGGGGAAAAPNAGDAVKDAIKKIKLF